MSARPDMHVCPTLSYDRPIYFLKYSIKSPMIGQNTSAY